MAHAEGRAGFDFGYIEGFADGAASIHTHGASARGNVGIRYDPEYIKSLGERLNPNNYYVKEGSWMPYFFSPWHHIPKKSQSEKISSVQALIPNHSRVRLGGRRMYGRRGFVGIRRSLYRRRKYYRRRYY